MGNLSHDFLHIYLYFSRSSGNGAYCNPGIERVWWNKMIEHILQLQIKILYVGCMLLLSMGFILGKK